MATDQNEVKDYDVTPIEETPTVAGTAYLYAVVNKYGNVKRRATRHNGLSWGVFDDKSGARRLYKPDEGDSLVSFALDVKPKPAAVYPQPKTEWCWRLGNFYFHVERW